MAIHPSCLYVANAVATPVTNCNANPSKKITTAWGLPETSSKVATPSSFVPLTRINQMHSSSSSTLVGTATRVRATTDSAGASSYSTTLSEISATLRETKASSSSSPTIILPTTTTAVASPSITHSTVGKFRDCIDPLSKIIAYAASNTSLHCVNKKFREIASDVIPKTIFSKFLVPCGLQKAALLLPNKQPDYQAMSRCLPKYYKLMHDEYIRRRPLAMHQDYISCLTEQTIPFGILPTNSSDLHLFHCNWSQDDLMLRKKNWDALFAAPPPPDFTDLAADALRRVSYFLAESFSNTEKLLGENGTLYSKSEELQSYLTKTPRFLSQLFRYIFDHIHFSANNAPSLYHNDLYFMANELFENHGDEYLTYEDLHYALLIQVHVVLTRTHVENAEEILHIHLIDSLLAKIKLKRTDLTALKEQLQYLLSPDQQEKRVNKMQEGDLLFAIKDEFYTSSEGVLHMVLKTINRQLNNASSSSTTGCCAIL